MNFLNEEGCPKMKCKDLISPSRSIEYAYKMGIDCVINGTNEINCHFSIFSSSENTNAWEQGKRDAEQMLLSESIR